MRVPIDWFPLMKRRSHVLVVGAAVAAFAAGGVALAAAGTDEKARLSNPRGAAPFAGPAGPNDPNKAAEKVFFERYAAWLDSPVAQSMDLRSLPRATLTAEFLPSEPSLDAATAKADIIAVGEAVDYKFGSWGSSVTLKVETIFKGEPASTLTVSLPGGPQPDNLEFTKATLVEGEATPILLPGDRALLFLQRSADRKRLSVQPYSGHYRVDAVGTVRPLAGNRFGRGLEGMTLVDLVAAIRQRVGP